MLVVGELATPHCLPSHARSLNGFAVASSIRVSHTTENQQAKHTYALLAPHNVLVLVLVLMLARRCEALQVVVRRLLTSRLNDVSHDLQLSLILTLSSHHHKLPTPPHSPMPLQPLPFTLVNAFAPTPHAGNPAAVVLFPAHDGRALNDEYLLSLARDFNLSETVFLSPLHPDDNIPQYVIRWFTPSTVSGERATRRRRP